jgi:hypothetical protein
VTDPRELARSTKEDNMPAVIDDSTALAQESATSTVVYTILYDLIATLNDAIEPGKEAYVTPIVAHLLRAGHARWLRDVDVEMLWDDPAPTLGRVCKL